MFKIIQVLIIEAPISQSEVGRMDEECFDFKKNKRVLVLRRLDV